MTEPFRILLVEDDRTAVELVKEALNEDDSLTYSLSLASDGEEALRILRMAPDKPNLVLLDLNLPKKTGIEVLKEIKRDPNLRVIPVIILTNSGSQEDVRRVYGYYCNAYVRKPMGFDKLVATVTATKIFWFQTATLPEVDKPAPPSSNPPKDRKSGARSKPPK